MNKNQHDEITRICSAHHNDRTRLMDIVIAVQQACGSVSKEAMVLIAGQIKAHRVEVEGVVSFFAFLSSSPKGKVVIRLCNDVVDKMKGYDEVAKAFCQELGMDFGQTAPEKSLSFEHTPCIGMCDQAPAALINDVVFPRLNAQTVKDIVRQLKNNVAPKDIPQPAGDGNNNHPLIRSAVRNNIMKKGAVLFSNRKMDAGLEKALKLSPEQLIAEVKTSKLRGRGGAGFPTGMKWEFTKLAKGDQKYVLCNADEGEPGTFKDRVLLTEYADLLFEGMTICAYAVGADAGILYLRGEYAYLRAFLENKLQERRKNKLLGIGILSSDFNFDIRIQSGAGAYICGEESALISSCEGLRGDPKTRPPFPPQKGYLGKPTVVNNVETFCCVPRILEQGAAWFSNIGIPSSTGTKLLSISGDCSKPGIYEYSFGVSIEEILRDIGAAHAQAVLVGGPSGQFINQGEFKRKINYDDLGTGGSMVIFDKTRDLLKIAEEYMDFFIEESCGFCTPCRVGNVLLKNILKKIIDGKGEPSDLSELVELGETIKATSRCGLGQTSPNPVLSTIKHFRSLYEANVRENNERLEPTFDLKAALKEAETVTGRKSVYFNSEIG